MLVRKLSLLTRITKYIFWPFIYLRYKFWVWRHGDEICDRLRSFVKKASMAIDMERLRGPGKIN